MIHPTPHRFFGRLPAACGVTPEEFAAEIERQQPVAVAADVLARERDLYCNSSAAIAAAAAADAEHDED